MIDKSFLDIKGENIKKGKIPIDLFNNKEDTFLAMAKEMYECIVNNNKNHKKTLFICPLGPVGQYKYFVELINTNKISLKNVTFINMDEYLDENNDIMPSSNPLSFKGIMYKLCYDKIDKNLIMDESQRIFPTKDNSSLIDKVILEHGGVDICFGGIGITGHMAFNEPPFENEDISYEDFINSTTRVQKISEETRVVNSMDEYNGAYYLMPKYCVTIGLKQILNSKKIRLYCFRDWHKSVIRRASFGPCSIDFPASLLQKHNDARIGVARELAE